MKTQSNIFIMIAITLLACGQLWGKVERAKIVEIVKTTEREERRRRGIIDDIESAKQDIEGKVGFSEIYKQIEIIGAKVSELDERQSYEIQRGGKSYSLKPSIIDIKTEYGELEKKFADALFENVETLFSPIMILIEKMKENVKKYKKVNIVDIDNKISDIISYLDDLHPILLMPYLSTGSTDPTWEKLHEIKLNMHEFLTNYIDYLTNEINYIQTKDPQAGEYFDYLTGRIKKIKDMLGTVQQIVLDNEKESFTSISEYLDKLKSYLDNLYKVEKEDKKVKIIDDMRKVQQAIRNELAKSPKDYRNIDFFKIHQDIESIYKKISELENNQHSSYIKKRYQELREEFAEALFTNLSKLTDPMFGLINTTITNKNEGKLDQDFRRFAENIGLYISAAFQKGLILKEDLIKLTKSEFKSRLRYTNLNIGAKLRYLLDKYIKYINESIKYAEKWFPKRPVEEIFFLRLGAEIEGLQSILATAERTFLSGEKHEVYINKTKSDLEELKKRFSVIREDFLNGAKVIKSRAQLAVLATTTTTALAALNGDPKLAIVAVGVALGAIALALSTVSLQETSEKEQRESTLTVIGAMISKLSNRMRNLVKIRR